MKWPRLRRDAAVPVDAVAELERSASEDIGARGPAASDTPRRSPPRGAKVFMALTLVIAIGAMAGLTWRALRTADGKKTASAAAARVENILPALQLRQSAPAPALGESPATTKPPAPDPSPSAPAGPEPFRPLQVLPELTPPLPDRIEQRRLASPLVGEQDERRPGNADSARPTSVPPEDSGPMADKLQPLRLQGSSARLLPDRNFLLTQGAMIDCAMRTRLVSAQAGMVTCHATREVRSASGKVVLIDAGTKFIGYQQGALLRGQPRIGVVWSRLETPSGVVIGLDSPGTGALGEAGLDGAIDTHFWERFGAAIMVSLLDDVGNWAAERGRSGNSIQFGGTSDAAESAVAKVLDNSINIPSTLYKNQAERIGIFIARDLDFSTVYALKPAG